MNYVMKNSYEIEKTIDASEYEIMLENDQNEIDNPDKKHPRRLMYVDRIRTIINIVRKLFPNYVGVSVGDFACAQTSIGLTLAELGYKVYAVDINPVSIEYAKMKYEKGEIEWTVSNILDLELPVNSLDVIISGELIEHCAYPEKIMEKILDWVRDDKYVILTTPNGSRLLNPLPTFSQVLQKGNRQNFEKQFSYTHLFLFKLEDIKCILPKNAEIVDSGYCGATVFFIVLDYIFERNACNLLKLFPNRFLELSSRILSRIPFVNKNICRSIYVVIQKKRI